MSWVEKQILEMNHRFIPTGIRQTTKNLISLPKTKMDSPISTASTLSSSGKKVTNRFDRYIRIIFHKILVGQVIKADAVVWLHNQLVTFIERICSEAFRYMQISKPCRVTMMERDMELGIFQILPHDMREVASSFLTQTLDRYDKSSNRSKTKRAGLYVSTGRCELYVRNFVEGHQIRRKVFIMVAACVQYLLTEVFQTVKGALEATEESERIKATTGVDEIIMITACEGDKGLATLFGLSFRSPASSSSSSLMEPKELKTMDSREDENEEDDNDNDNDLMMVGL